MFQKISFVVLCLMILAGCTARPTPSTQTSNLTGKLAYETAPQFTESELQKLVASQNEFAGAIFLHEVDPKANLVLSPYSLYQALSMLYAGAAGETASEMRQAMRLPWEDSRVHRLVNALNQQLLISAGTGDKDGQVFDLRIPNALWADKNGTYEPAFLDTLSQNYDSGMKILNFNDASAAADAINAWVAEQTEQKITQLAEPAMFNTDTALALTNAVYFKAAWQSPFNEAATVDAPFTLLDGQQQNVPTMRLSQTLEVSVTDELTTVRLPYVGGTMVMEILMPSLNMWNSPEGVGQLWSNQANFPEMQPENVSLSLPKFQIETPIMDLIPALKANGMQLAFTDQADFSGISGDQSLYVSTIAQKAFIDVNEKGTEASAATIAVVQQKSAPSGEPLQIKIDRPFIFQIRDTATGAILFMGTVMHP
jgi:serpin B